MMRCPFCIKVRTTPDGTSLFVKEINDEHNLEPVEPSMMNTTLSQWSPQRLVDFTTTVFKPEKLLVGLPSEARNM